MRLQDDPAAHETEMFYHEADDDCPHPRPDDCEVPLEECPHDGYCPLDEWYDQGHVSSSEGFGLICLETPFGLVCGFCTEEYGDPVLAEHCKLLTNPCGHMYCDPDECEDDFDDTAD